MQQPLQNLVRIVLVETSHPGNIGGVARAMKNMQLSDLVLVNPLHFPHADAIARSSGADDILQQATVCDSFAEALTGCSWVIGTSARQRNTPWPTIIPRQLAEQLQGKSSDSKLAIVFGRENSGLTNSELEFCNMLLHIPANPDYSSLNLATAVQVVAYELFSSYQQWQPQLPSGSAADNRVTHEQMERFYDHLTDILLQIEFLDPNNPRQLMRKLRLLFNRLELEQVELNILRGILTHIGKKLDQKGT